jgi:glycosyltransferase involved in cell wall biosynthesis
MTEQNKPKVLLIQQDLKNYRDPIYKLISAQVDLTVGYTVSADFTESSYPIIQLPYKKIWNIIWHKGLIKIINQYDVVVFVPHLVMLRTATLPFVPHKPRLVTWSLGVHASYYRPYDLTKKPDVSDKLFELIQDHADACIFYMPEPIEYWKKYKRIDERKYFVAHNTVVVAPFDESETSDRNIILFVGTLYKQKGIGDLLECYATAKERVGTLPKLIIVGNGPEKDVIEEQIRMLHLENDVELTGPIYEEDRLKDLFVKSVICVSPRQAGLTVLKSIGYGVPFVTRTNAVTGGERSNVISGKTGILYNTESELVDILCKTATEPKLYSAMSQSAMNYYRTVASPEGMAQGVVDAIYFALKKER